ncbi:conserved hypothetical protein [Curtobacterium sp. 8I-2]|nr:conserved hypothetical protein [Curtobacterium sp. 8I-2]
MGARAAMVITCDEAGCDQVVVPMAGVDDNSSRTEARAYAREHGWTTADRSPSWTDLCPAHTAAHRAAASAVAGGRGGASDR